MIDISQAVDKLRRKDWLGSGMSGGERRRVTIICRHEAMGDRSMVISAAPDDLVESLLATFCLEVNIQLESDAVLRSADRHLIDPAVTVAEAGLQNGDIITLEHLSENHVQLRHTFWPLCILAFLIGAAGLCAILILFFLPAVPIADYGVVVNGGYSQSQVFSYKWNRKRANFSAENIHQLTEFCTADTVLSNFTSNPDRAGESLSACLNLTQSQNIPSDRQSASPIYVAATSGIRLLRLRNSTVTEAIMTSVANETGRYPFQLETVEILSGTDETVYIWMAANWLLDSLSETEKSPTVGIVDLDGGTASISFEISDSAMVSEHSDFNATLFGQRHHLFVQNSMCYGYVEAERKIFATLIKSSPDPHKSLRNPCGQKGIKRQASTDQIFTSPCVDDIWTELSMLVTFEGTGDPVGCSNLTARLFEQPACKWPECSINETFTSIWPQKFVATNDFNLIATKFGVSKGMSLETLRDTVKQYCQKPAKNEESVQLDYCFLGLYGLQLLIDGFGFNQSTFERIQFVNQIEQTNIGWPLGFMLVSSEFLPADPLAEQIDFGLFICLCVLFGFLLLMAGCFCVLAIKSDRKSAGTGSF